MSKKYFLICLEDSSGGYDRGWPLDRLPKTLKQVQADLRWQEKGGFSADDYRVAVASEIAGLFEYESEGKPRPVLFDKGPYTESAFREIHLQIWGDKV